MKPLIQLIPQRPVVCRDRQTALSVLVQVRAPQVDSVRRPNLNVGLCIDRSGSMHGTAITRAKEAGCHLIERLDSTDLISVIAFSDVIEVLASAREVGLNAFAVAERLQRITAQGNTALHEGWVEAAHQTHRGVGRGRLSRVILLSDGEANVGLTEPSRIASDVANWRSRGITTSTVGLGERYNEDLLSQMSRSGGGNFYHVRTPEDILSVFQTELHTLFSTAAQSLSFGIKPQDGVELLRVVNPIEKNMDGRWEVSDLAYGYTAEIVIELLVPPTPQAADLCEINLDWYDLETGERQQIKEVLRLPAVPHGQLSEFPLHPKVTQKKAIQEAVRLIDHAVALIGRREHAQARQALQEGISTLELVSSSPEVEDALKQLRKLLADLHQGQTSEARKHASSVVRNYGSFSLAASPGVSEFLNLPKEMQTPEKLKEILERHHEA